MYNIAVVGCGFLADTWIEYALNNSVCNIAALVDTNLQNAESKKTKYSLNAKTYDNLNTCLKKEHIDIVFDITPPEFHFNVISTALSCNCHVFGEKPMSDNLKNAYEMVQMAEKTKKEYFVMQNKRYQPYLQSLKCFLQSKKLGSVGQLSANFRMNPNLGGFRATMENPLISDLAVHIFDAARFLLGKTPVSVYCKEFNHAWSWSKGDACAVCIFEADDGTIFDFRGSWCANGIKTTRDSEWFAACENGAVFWDGDKDLYFEPLPTLADKISDNYAKHKNANCFKIKPTEMSSIGHTACLDEMFNALRDGLRPPTDCRDNLNTIIMVQKAIQSSKENKHILF